MDQLCVLMSFKILPCHCVFATFIGFFLPLIYITVLSLCHGIQAYYHDKQESLFHFLSRSLCFGKYRSSPSVSPISSLSRRSSSAPAEEKSAPPAPLPAPLPPPAPSAMTSAREPS